MLELGDGSNATETCQRIHVHCLNLDEKNQISRGKGRRWGKGEGEEMEGGRRGGVVGELWETETGTETETEEERRRCVCVGVGVGVGVRVRACVRASVCLSVSVSACVCVY